MHILHEEMPGMWYFLIVQLQFPIEEGRISADLVHEYSASYPFESHRGQLRTAFHMSKISPAFSHRSPMA